MLPWIGGAVGGFILYALIKPQAMCAVLWSGPYDTKVTGLMAKLSEGGFTVENGRVQQVISAPLKGENEQRRMTLLVKPSELEAARTVIEGHVLTAPEQTQ